MAAKTNLEIKVGIFVFIGLVIFVMFIFSISKFYIFNPGYYVNIIFGYADGIAVSAPVRLAGYEIGEVKDVKIFYDSTERRTKIEVLVWVKKDVKIEEDADIFVNSLGLMGEKYIEISPGTIGSSLLKNNDTIIGDDTVPFKKLADQGFEILNQSKIMVSNINEIFGSDENKEKLKDIPPDLSASLKRLNSILSKIDDGEGTLGKLINDDVIYVNIAAFTEDIKNNPWKLLYKPRNSERK